MKDVFQRKSKEDIEVTCEITRDVYDALPSPVVLYRNWRVIHINEAACRLLKTSQAAIAGTPVFHLLKRDHHRVIKRIIEKLKPGHPFTMFVELKDSEGNLIQTEMTSILVDRGSDSYVMTTIRENANERPYNDVSALVVDLMPLSGRVLYRKLVRSLASHLEMDLVLLARYEPHEQTDNYEGLAMELDSELHERFSLDLFEDLAAVIVKDGSIMALDAAADKYPFVMQQCGLQSMIGICLYNESNDPIGVLIACSYQPLKDPDYVFSTMNLLGVKAATELQRFIDHRNIENSERRYRLLMEQAVDPILISKPDGSIEQVNNSACELLGYSVSELLRMNMSLIFAAENDRPANDKTLEVWQLIRKDGGSFFAEISSAVQADGYRQYILRDITERLRAEAERKSHLVTLSLLEELVIELDEELRITQVNDAWPKLFGSVDPDSKPHFPSLLHSDYTEIISQTLYSMFLNPRKIQLRFPVQNAGNDIRWYEARFITLKDQTGSGIRGLIRDTTVDYLSEKKRHFATYHDGLTGLPNRAQMQEDLQRFVGQCQQNGGKIAFCLLDLDRFFEINEILGHHLGDQVIALFAEKLKSIEEISHYLYRWGGDQFVFILDSAEESDLEQIIKTVLESFMKPVQFESENIHVTASGGIAVYPDDTAVPDELIGLADRALNWAKKHGRYTIKLASELPRKSFLGNELTMKRLLAEAIHQEEIEAYFQPIVDAKTRKITGMEALARCPDRPGYGRIGPGIFIPIVENMGLIGELGAVIMKKGMSFLSKLKQQGYDLTLSVNLSRRQLYSDDLTKNLVSYAKQFGLNTGDIMLEVTESLAMLEFDQESKKLFELRNAGFKVAIDDFGTGYSTLAQLHEMPVDELKIDMAFVRRIHSSEGYRILQAIVSLGKALHLYIVAEGVEEQLAEERLRDLNIDGLQGYHYSPPVTAEEFEKLLKDLRPESESAAI